MPTTIIRTHVDSLQYDLLGPLSSSDIDQFTNQDQRQYTRPIYNELAFRLAKPTPAPPPPRKPRRIYSKQDQMDLWPSGRAVNGVPVRWPHPKDFRKGVFEPEPVPVAPEPEYELDTEADVEEPVDTGLFAAVDLQNEDELDLKLAKLMFNRFVYDIGYKGFAGVTLPSQVHLFRKAVPDQRRKVMRTLDMVNAIIWLYSLHPQEVQISSEWVCDMMEIDIDVIRSIVARNRRDMIKKTIQLLFQDNKASGQVYLDKVSDFVNVTGWSFD